MSPLTGCGPPHISDPFNPRWIFPATIMSAYASTFNYAANNFLFRFSVRIARKERMTRFFNLPTNVKNVPLLRFRVDAIAYHETCAMSRRL